MKNNYKIVQLNKDLLKLIINLIKKKCKLIACLKSLLMAIQINGKQLWLAKLNMILRLKLKNLKAQVQICLIKNQS